MKITLYSVDEANRLLAKLRPVLERLVGANRELDRLDRRIDVLQLAAAGAAAANPDARELAGAVERRSGLVEEIKHSIQEIQAQGPVVKDLERGLVDFYSLSLDQLIFLCWQLGETEIGHWHTLSGGFSSRQPLHRSERE